VTTPNPGQTILESAVPGAGVLRVDGVTKVFGHGAQAVQALDRISLEVTGGEFVCLVGASGCGKSTLLHLLVGLDSPTTGRLSVDGRTALMFQEAALFPWLTVACNIGLALRLRGVPRKDRRPQVDALLEAVHLEGFGDRQPHELSGGMRQRVALARALAQDADVLLMDEPFGSLDAMTRDLLHAELERLWTDRRFTVLFVTHNVREAVRLADRVLVLTARPGRVSAAFDVRIPRPRRIETPAVSALAGEITEQLSVEVRRHGHA
jgi:NitT/TauT family transport system ATP-binding protein